MASSFRRAPTWQRRAGPPAPASLAPPRGKVALGRP
jgi:hypothetical protein